MKSVICTAAVILSGCSPAHAPSPPAAPNPVGLPWVRIGPDGTGFVLESSGPVFRPWGVNYDHDPSGRLIEDYWINEWARVEEDFAEIKRLGANVVRIHLQFGRFMLSPEQPNSAALEQLEKLLRLAEREGLYLDLTGLGCYHKAEIPKWYDALDESQRWNAQARFWVAVAERCRESPAVFCYDLMNEPVVPGSKRGPGEWLGPAFAGKHFVQFISLDQKDRPRPEIARQWIAQVATAIRGVDRRHLITVGLVDWSLDRPGLTSGFVPKTIAPELDFLAVHIYPEKGKGDAALETLKGFSVGKPIVVEECFPLKCSGEELESFIDRAGPLTAGWVSFYWGKTPEELKKSKGFAESLTLDWLTRFQARSARMTGP
jgi:cellulase (glycosyl hydrolase family 5)